MKTPTTRRQRMAGFTLIELMVAMVLGMLTTLIIAETLLKSEGNKRATTNGSDAQVNGALSLFAIQRDVQMAGYGVASKATALGCTISAKRGAAATSTAVLAPVVINTTNGGGQDKSDTVTILSSAKSSYALPMDLSTDHTSASTSFSVKSALGVAVGDFMMAVPKTPSASKGCTLFEVTAVDPVVGTITHSTSSSWNTSLSTLMPTYVSDDDSVINMGSVKYRVYSVDTTNNALVSQDLDMSTGLLGTAQTINTNIVLIKAMYGRDVNKDGTIDTYDDTPPSDWSTVKAIRIAVVARSANRSQTQVITKTDDPTFWWDVGTVATASPTSSPLTCVPSVNPTSCHLTLKVPTTSASSTDTNEWKFYHYKVYDTLIPIRNMLWSS